MLSWAMLLDWSMASTFANDSRTYILLKEARPEIAFVPYTPLQRQNVADTINTMMTIYVNREQKISYYGKEKPDIDPIPRLQALSKRVANMTDLEMHYAYAKVFLSLRDLHASYRMPAPHRCYTAITPVSFTFAQGQNRIGPPKVVVSRVSTIPEILALFPQSKLINIGDELLTINGITFEEYYQRNKFNFSGANEWGGKRIMLRTLSKRSGMLHPMPEKDDVLYELKSFKSGHSYTVIVPWIANRLHSCLAQYANFTSNQNSTFLEAPRQNNTNVASPIPRAVIVNNDNFVLIPTDIPAISWGIWKPKTKNMGVIVCESFLIPGGNVRSILLRIRRLLLNELRNTTSLLWDIRSNEGGLIHLADSIPQLFQSHIVTTLRRAVVAPPNEYIMLNSTRFVDPWHQAYLKVKPGDKYTPWTRLTSVEGVNALGAVYVKPVGVFTNGYCYSACETFTASMKDNNVATIFGEDTTTGGGGANVALHNTFLVRLNPRDFKEMPYQKELLENAQEVSIAWRQTVRVKAMEGVLIEDYGIRSHYRILPTELDLMPNTTQNSQYDRIADILIKEGIDSGRDRLFFYATPTLGREMTIGSNITLQLELEGVQKVQVLDPTNETIATLEMDHDSIATRQFRKIQFVPRSTKPITHRYELKAFDVHGKQVLTTYRFFSYPVQPQNFANVTLQPMEFQGNASYVGLYERGFHRNGWQIQGSKFWIAKGYSTNLDSNLLFFFNSVSKPVTLKIKGECFIQKSDFLRVIVADTKGSKVLGRFNGKARIDTTYTFSPEGAFNVNLYFSSDVAPGKDGITFESISITL